MSFDGHVSTAFPGDREVDDVVTAGEAESDGDRTSSEEVRSPSSDSASPAVTTSSTSQSPRDLIKPMRLKGDGKLNEDDSEDDLDDGSLSTWLSIDNPKDPKGGNLEVSWG